MSNLSAHRPADYRLESFLPKEVGWEEESLFASSSRSRVYGETDWSEVPRIDFASGGFNQLSTPEPAEVIEEGGDFVLDDLDGLKQLGSIDIDTSATAQQRSGQARALTLEIEKTKYKIQDLSRAERLVREKLKNPEAHSNADQPFIPTYGESRRALLKKLGFSDDYELNLRGDKGPGIEKSKALDANSPPLDNNELETGELLENFGSNSDSNQTGIDRETNDESPLDKKLADYLDNETAATLVDQAENGQSDETAQELAKQSASKLRESSEALEKAFEQGYQKGLLEANEKAATEEALQKEIALKEEQARQSQELEREKTRQAQRSREKAEYEQEIQKLKEKIKSFDDSLLGELDKQKEQLDQETRPRIKLLTQLCDELKLLTEDPQAFFEPLKRLSVHIAEQLVLGELSTSAVVIDRLIERCLQDLDLRGTPLVNVELNALDEALLAGTIGEFRKNLRITVSQNLQVGSVRVSVNETQIDDLIQNRLETLASRLLGQPEEWRAHSPLMHTTRDKSYWRASDEVVKNEVDSSTATKGEADLSAASDESKRSETLALQDNLARSDDDLPSAQNHREDDSIAALPESDLAPADLAPPGVNKSDFGSLDSKEFLDAKGGDKKPGTEESERKESESTNAQENRDD